MSTSADDNSIVCFIIASILVCLFVNILCFFGANSVLSRPGCVDLFHCG